MVNGYRDQVLKLYQDLVYYVDWTENDYTTRQWSEGETIYCEVRHTKTDRRILLFGYEQDSNPLNLMVFKSIFGTNNSSFYFHIFVAQTYPMLWKTAVGIVDEVLEGHKEKIEKERLIGEEKREAPRLSHRAAAIPAEVFGITAGIISWIILHFFI